MHRRPQQKAGEICGLAFGGALFRFLKKIGVVRTGGMVDTFDD